MAFGVIDGVSGDAYGLEVIENVVFLFFRQVVVVAVNVLNHFLPSGRRRRGRGDIDKLYVLTLHLLLHGCHRLVPCTTGAAPRSPEVDEHGLALILVDDGL